MNTAAPETNNSNTNPAEAPPQLNDNSNPQQGTGGLTQQKPTTNFPPTLKDERKLFVGGLPPDGKSSSELVAERGFSWRDS